MTSRAADSKQRGHMFRRNRQQKRSLKTNCDSESEMVVTSTSGKKIRSSASQNVKRDKVFSKTSILSKTSMTSKALSSLKSASKLERSLQSIKRQPARSSTSQGDVLPATLDARDMESAHSSGGQRLLMREWLIQEASGNRIPGLKWLDQHRTLISIPWIHASKEGWSQDHHCKLFEKWAIYTGKYDPNKDKPEPKRWKANFRCALNSLPDVTEVPEMGQKNGANGFKVYRFIDPVTRKNPRKYKLHSESTKHCTPVKVSFQATLSNPSTVTDANYAEKFTDFHGRSLSTAGPSYAVIACNTELIHDTVPSSDQCFTSISDIELVTVVVGDIPEMEATTVLCLTPGTSSSEKDIILLRNMDHNYFKVQIPTTVENYEDDDKSTLSESQLTRSRKNPAR